MGTTDKYCLRWNDYRSNISVAIQDLRTSADFFDVTLATDEAEIQAHKVILSACSPHLRSLFKRYSYSQNSHLIVYLRGVRHQDLEAILEFMYNGEVNVLQEDLNSFLSVAEDLQVKGLTQNTGGGVKGGPTNVANRTKASSNVSSSQQTPCSKNGISSTGASGITGLSGAVSGIGVGSGGGGSGGGSGAAASALGSGTSGSGASMAKRAKRSLEPKENQQLVVTPDVTLTFDDADVDNDDGPDQNDDDHIKYESGNGEDEMYSYGRPYESDSGDVDPMLDPSLLSVAGTSLDANKDEQEYLRTEIADYLTSMSARLEDGQYQCLVCARLSRDLYNQRQHVMTHMMKDENFLERLDTYIKGNLLQQNASSYSCLLCKIVINKGYYMVRHHFFSKHLKEEKYSEVY